MFILHYPDGKTLTEKNGCWDNHPENISGMELTLPFTPKMKKPDGQVIILPARTISISNFETYYFSKEGVSSIMAGGKMQPSAQQVAEIMGGINYSKNYAFEVRVDRNGNIKVSTEDIQEIKKKYTPQAFKQGVTKE